MKRYVAVLSLFSMVSAMPAQQAPRFEEQVEVSVVEVAVNVVGRDGGTVRGLKKENFEIYDEGQKRQIEYFEAVDTAPPAPNQAAPRIANPTARRSFLLVFDLTNSVPGTIGRARDAARRFVANSVRDGDLVAVSSFSVEGGFRLLTAFTSDRDLLVGAIDALADSRAFRTADPLLLSGNAGRENVQREPTAPAGGDRKAELEEIAKDLDRLNRAADDSFRRGRVEAQIDSFAAVAKMLDRMRGRKQLILLSEGFDAMLLSGREQLSSSESVEENTAATAGEVWKVNNDRRFGNSAAAAKLQQMGDIFKRSDVVLHCIDIKGIRSNVDAREGLKANSNEGLYLLANSTGGQVFKNDNNLAMSFDRLVKEQEVTYVLAFRAPRSKTPGAFHNIKVKLRDVNGAARVFHRAGYYESGGKLSAMEQTLSAVDIMMSDVPLRDVPMNILAAPFPAEGANAQVPVIIEVPGAALAEGITTKDLEAELFVYAFDKGDSVEDFLYQRISLDLSRVADALKKSGIKYYGTLSLPAGDYKLRTLLRVKGSNHDGFQRVDLHVPDFGLPTVLRPFVFEEPGKWIMVKGNSHAGNAEYPFAVSESFIPAADAIVDVDKEARIALFTYNIGEKIQLSATVEDPSGGARNAKLSLVGRTPVDDNGATKLLFDFIPQGLKPGSYVLAFDIRDEERQKSQSVSVPITVQ